MAQRQRGSVWVVLLVLFAIVVGAWQYNGYKAEKKRVALEQAAQQQAAAAKLEEEGRREQERLQLEKRLAEAQQARDALTAANKSVDDLIGRWEDAVKIAGTTGRIALSGPVSAMQALRRDAEQITVSPCMDQAKGHLVKHMGSTIEAFLVFMRNEMKIGDTLAGIYFDSARKELAEFRTARAACPQ